MKILSDTDYKIAEIIDRVDIYKFAMHELANEWEESEESSFALLVVGADIANKLDRLGNTLHEMYCRMP